tara:strand:- start:1538 stop:2641 length:1104 start_codon:yes stop_codon:yes gene_type:complete
MNQNFENKTINYNLKKYPWNEWVLEEVQKKWPHVVELSLIHEVLKEHEIFELTITIQNLFATEEKWMRRLSTFAKEIVPELIDNKPFLIKRQPTLNLVVPNQEKIARRLPFHQGIFYDNGRGQGTIWMPLTSAFDTNSMWVIDTKKSKEITKNVIKNGWNLEKFENECLKVAYPVNLEPGQAHLFNQEIIHGNVNNETNLTRLSFDWHVLPKGEEFYRRLPGGFFRHPDDHSMLRKRDYSNQRYITYLSNNHNLSKFWPKNFQRAIINNYIKEIGIKNNGTQYENEFLDNLPVLDHYLDQDINGMVFCSIYQLPDDSSYFLNKALNNKVILHFANEGLILENESDLDYIKMYRSWGVEKKGPFSWEQ